MTRHFQPQELVLPTVIYTLTTTEKTTLQSLNFGLPLKMILNMQLNIAAQMLKGLTVTAAQYHVGLLHWLPVGFQALTNVKSIQNNDLTYEVFYMVQILFLQNILLA